MTDERKVILENRCGSIVQYPQFTTAFFSEKRVYIAEIKEIYECFYGPEWTLEHKEASDLTRFLNDSTSDKKSLDRYVRMKMWHWHVHRK